VVLVLEDGGLRLLVLGGDLVGVVVVESVPLVAEPDADADLEAELLGLVELGVDVVGAPRAERVAADVHQHLLRRVAAGALDEERLAVHAQLVAAGRRLGDRDFGRRGERRRGNGQDRGERDQSECGRGTAHGGAPGG
jgi:hypothetical protein